MSNNHKHPNPWIGHSTWRTLINLENQVIVSKQVSQQQVLKLNGHTLNSDYPKSQEDRVLNIYSVQDLGAAVVFFSGHSILINTPPGLFDKLAKVTERLPHRIMILGWDEAEIDGLFEYCYHYAQLPNANNLELHVSEWAWDTIKNRAWDLLISKERATNNYHQFFLSALVHHEKDANSFLIHTKTFKKFTHHRIFPQVEWWMRYSLATKPCMEVQFRLFDTFLTINHEIPFPYQQYQSEVLIPILQREPVVAKGLQRVINLRLGDLIQAQDVEQANGVINFNLYPSFFTYNLFAKKIVKSDENNLSKPGLKIKDIFPQQIKNNGFKMSEYADRLLSKQKPPILKMASAPNWKGLKTKVSTSSKIFLAISCGGLSGTSNRQITPATRVSINKMNLSLLGFKLYELLKDQNSPSPVFQKKLILLISPWTETNVRQEISKLLWEFRNEFETVLQPEDIIYLRQTVLPRCFKKNGELIFFEQNSFQFNPAGHFDFLKSLVDENYDLEKSLGIKNGDAPIYIYHTIFKNLGQNINENVRWMANYMQDKSNATLLFELVRQHEEKGKGSYWVQGENGQPHLTKPVYFNQKSLSDLTIQTTDNQSHLLMSTHSFLIDLQRLKQKAPLLNHPNFYVSERLSLRSNQEIANGNYQPVPTIQFEKDIDQVTAFMSSEGVEIDMNEQGVAKRFIPIKQEKDLYKNKVKVLEQVWSDEQKVDIAFKKALPSHTPFLLEPNEKNDTWGGYRIRDEKNLPMIDEKVSETWEASMHHKGVSGIKFDALNSVPISTFLAESDLDIMFKMLDCNSWLSIQLHPSQKTCEALTEQLPMIEQEFLNKKWDTHTIKNISKILNNREDDNGKEEIFYILDNRNYIPKQSKNEPNLVLGLNKTRLAVLQFLSEKEWKNYLHHFKKAVAKEDLIFIKLKQAILESTFGQLKHFLPNPDFTFSEDYQKRFEHLLDEYLPMVLRLRAAVEATPLLALHGILFIFTLQAIKETIQQHQLTTLKVAFGKSKLPLFDYFYKVCPKPGSILQVKPGLLHALGKGIYAVEASNRSNNTFRIFDHGRELSSVPRPLHYLLAAVGLSSDSFVEQQNEHQFIFPREEFTDKENIRLKVFSTNKLRKLHHLKFPDQEGILIMCTRGSVKITTTYEHSASSIPQTTILDLKPAYTAYLPPTQERFKRIVTLVASDYAPSECVVVSAVANKSNSQDSNTISIIKNNLLKSYHEVSSI